MSLYILSDSNIQPVKHTADEIIIWENRICELFTDTYVYISLMNYTEKLPNITKNSHIPAILKCKV